VDPDPGSGAFLTPWIRDPGWVKNQDPNPGSGMNNPDHISESLETIYLVKILKFFNADRRSGIQDPGWKKSDPGWKKLGSGVNILDPQRNTVWINETNYCVVDPDPKLVAIFGSRKAKPAPKRKQKENAFLEELDVFSGGQKPSPFCFRSPSWKSKKTV
jgi:hypothetical protein